MLLFCWTGSAGGALELLGRGSDELFVFGRHASMGARIAHAFVGRWGPLNPKRGLTSTRGTVESTPDSGFGDGARRGRPILLLSSQEMMHQVVHVNRP